MKASACLSFLCLVCLPATALKAQDHKELAQQLSQRLGDQVSRTANGETLRASWENPNQYIPTPHVFLVRIDKGIEVVTESHTDERGFTQKDYFLHESKVYAHRISRHEPSTDGKTKRVAESYILFDKGTPFYRSGFTARVPLTEKSPDLTKTKNRTPEVEIPLPSGLEGWGDKLTARAFDIARTFRNGVGRYTYGNWDSWLLKDAPPEGAGTPPKRPQDWLPPVGTLVLPIEDSTSPDGIYSIGWGYEKGPVDWAKLREPNNGPEVVPPLFSSKIGAGPITGGLENDTNFLLHHLTGKPICRLGIYYPGERQRFNHDELIAHWSPSDACVVTIVTAKWFSEFGHIAWIKDGASQGSQDILEPLKQAVEGAVLKSKHPAARRMRGEDKDSFCYTLSKILLEDDGSFEASVTGQIPKDEEIGGYFDVIISGTFSCGPDEGPALLKDVKTTVSRPTE